ncbi:type I phosphodiesterase/nucleotide pyrophosphatase [Stackebrandtia albiflava]|uniref:Type I phosphodiesterase/nucleotide pyrophosphatase n=1 Tax=Stackebrandtia albiflava TaxID=406432 RepID=A0A562VGT2_9ACTN|nr:nucleotide pyrophosphatase/phosphodiesterase family protein [Stackebrandtia albiflava]TWJ17088.1 type I phosphodiesterase/nucleotide pyrophosphatase [Stackebrandtia albiflava]
MLTDPDLLRQVSPEYRSAGLCDVLPSTLAVLGVPGETDILGLGRALPGVERVVCLLVDGLGYHLYPLASVGSALLSDAVTGRRGEVRRLTTGFPSTTPTSLASYGTGAPPGEHGITAFTVNVPGTDDVLVHILWGDEPDPYHWQPLTTCFERAAAAGVLSTLVSPAFEHTGLDRAVYRGARHLPAEDVTELATGVRRALATPGRQLVHAYYAGVDKAGHRYGVGSAQWHAEVMQLDWLLSELLADADPRTAVLVTADHGMINVPDDSRIRIEEPHREGVRLICGEPRARYLYTSPGEDEAVAARWRGLMGDRARVLTRREAVDAGWFGKVPDAHLERIGDVVVVCNDDYVLLGAPESDSPYVEQLKALHGGLTEAEMAVPLWIAHGGR